MSSDGVTFTDVLTSEWIKTWTVRSTLITAVATVVLGAAFGALIGYGGAQQYHTMSPAERPMFDPTATSLRSYIVAQLAVGVLGALNMAAEYATGMILTSLAGVPRRGRLFAAKATVTVVVAYVVGTAVAFGAFVAGQSVLAGQGVPSATLGQPGVLRAVLGCGLYLTAVGLLGFAVATLTRSAVGATSVLVAITLVVPAFAPALPGVLSGWAQQFWPTMAGAQIMTVRHDPLLPGPWEGYAAMCAVLALTTAAALAVFYRRDA